MPQIRKEILVSGEIYHIFNHSIADEEIFSEKIFLRRAFSLINYYRFPQKLRYSQFKKLPNVKKDSYRKEFLKLPTLVEIYAFAFMPNHYHLLLRQNQEKGITLLISNFQNSFAKYLNTKNKRKGSLFQRPFKSKRIINDEVLIHVSRYIHLNPVSSFIIEYQRLEDYPFTSYPDYLGKRNHEFINKEFILKIFGNKEKYQKFVSDQVDYQRKLQVIKKYLLE